MQSYTLALALGLLLNGGWEDAPPARVTAAVTDDDGGVSATSHDWKAHATFRGAGRTISVISNEQFSTPEECQEFLRNPEVRAALMLLLAEMKELDLESHVIAECLQLTIPG